MKFFSNSISSLEYIYIFFFKCNLRLNSIENEAGDLELQYGRIDTSQFTYKYGTISILYIY